MPRTDTAGRVIAAAPDRVYAALTDPDALSVWLPPTGMTGRFERFDLRKGGSYRLVLIYEDSLDSPGKATADTDVVEARFLDLEPGKMRSAGCRIRIGRPGLRRHHDHQVGALGSWRWDPVTITAEDVPDGNSAEDHAAGLASSLENLARFVEG
jgi:hypothetical protein